tara:strand:- start:1208 stop:1351 length:144 start_codon:yes stop_codon:yes gene_type:complete
MKYEDNTIKLIEWLQDANKELKEENDKADLKAYQESKATEDWRMANE